MGWASAAAEVSPQLPALQNTLVAAALGLHRKARRPSNMFALFLHQHGMGGSLWQSTPCAAAHPRAFEQHLCCTSTCLGKARAARLPTLAHLSSNCVAQALALAKHAMSGCRHSKDAAVGAPSLKPPVMTSSKMTIMPRARHAYTGVKAGIHISAVWLHLL